MENINIKMYEADETIEKAIKKLTVDILVEENGLLFKDCYLNKDYNDANLYIWYAQRQDKILATMMLKQLSTTKGRIENVCCCASYRGTGIAKRLLEEVIEFSKMLNLETLQLGTYDNLKRAIKFYEKYGFVEKDNQQRTASTAKYYELVL